MPYGGINLSLSTLLSAESPRNFFNLLLAGLPAPVDGRRGPIMPGFAAMLTDQQVVALASYMRSQFSNKPAWPEITAQLREARDDHTASQLSSGAQPSPAIASK